MIGFGPKGSIGLGRVNVRGRRRVPSPPAKTTVFKAQARSRSILTRVLPPPAFQSPTYNMPSGWFRMPAGYPPPLAGVENRHAEKWKSYGQKEMLPEKREDQFCSNRRVNLSATSFNLSLYSTIFEAFDFARSSK